MKTRPYHYCIMQVGKDPKIIEVQGLTWFETDDLAYEYWGHMNMEFQKKIGPISVISEENLPYFFDCNSEYIKAKLTGTRLLKSKEPVGVKVTNDQKVISEYYKPTEGPSKEQMKDGIDIGIYMDLNDDNPFKRESIVNEGSSAMEYSFKKGLE